MWQNANIAKNREPGKTPGQMFCVEFFSLLFAAGVALGSVVGLRGGAAYAASGITAILCAAVPMIKRPLAVPAVFLLGGFLAFTLHSLGWAAFEGPVPQVQRAGVALKEFIGSLPFRDDGTAPLLKAFLCGDRSGLGKEAVQVFRKAGASHLLALSGLHMGILYMVFDKLSRPMGKYPAVRIARFVVLIGASAFFTLMTGASPSMVRAFLFILTGETASLLGREKKLGRTLCTALLLQLAITPEAITSAGFQLSYLAMAGIVLLYPVMDKWYPSGGKPSLMRKIWKMSAMAISCQVFTAPLTLYLFGSFPRHFLLTNLLAIPITTCFIAAALAVLGLSALGICPGFLYGVADGLGEALRFCLEVISSL